MKLITRVRLASLGALAALGAVAAAPAPAGAATLGLHHIGIDSNGGVFCGGFETCAQVQTHLPDGLTRAPSNGTITHWKVNLDTPGSLRLVVLRKQPDKTFKAVDASTVKAPTAPGVHSYDARLTARKGDFIGLDLLDEEITIQTLSAPGAFLDFFQPDFGTSAQQTRYDPFSGGLTELELKATLTQ